MLIEADPFAPESEANADYLDRIVLRTRLVATRQPYSSRARANYGLALFAIGSLGDAEKEFSEARRLDPDDYLANASLARVWAAQDRLDEARALLANMNERHPGEWGLAAGLADIEERRGRIEGSLSLWMDAVRLRPDSAWLKYRLGIAHLRLGQKRRAIAALREAARESVRSPMLHHGLAVGFLLSGATDKAVRSFQAALALAPRMREAQLGLANAYLALGQPAKAIENLRHYLETNPADHEAREWLAFASIKNGDPRTAQRSLNLALAAMVSTADGRSSDVARIRNNLGVCALQMHHIDAAEKEFEASISVVSIGTTPYHNLARVQFQAGHAQRALVTLDAAESLFPGHTDTRLLRAVCLDAVGKSDTAIYDLSDWVGDGSAPPAAWAVLGEFLCDSSNDLDTAVRVLSEANELFPRDAMVVNNFAYVLLMANQPAAARQVLESFPARNLPKAGPLIAIMTATRGLLSLREGDPQLGEERYREAAKIAHKEGLFDLEATALQKMHVELALWHLAHREHKSAVREVRLGLNYLQPSRYRRDLERLDRDLRQMQAQQPSSELGGPNVSS